MEIKLNGVPVDITDASFKRTLSKPVKALPLEFSATFECAGGEFDSLFDAFEALRPTVYQITRGNVSLWVTNLETSTAGFTCEVIDVGSPIGDFIWRVYRETLPLETLSEVLRRMTPPPCPACGGPSVRSPGGTSTWWRCYSCDGAFICEWVDGEYRRETEDQ